MKNLIQYLIDTSIFLPKFSDFHARRQQMETMPAARNHGRHKHIRAPKIIKKPCNPGERAPVETAEAVRAPPSRARPRGPLQSDIKNISTEGIRQENVCPTSSSSFLSAISERKSVSGKACRTSRSPMKSLESILGLTGRGPEATLRR